MRALIVILALAISCLEAFADFVVQSSREGVRVTAEQAELSDVIGAINDRFHIRFSSSVPLSRQIDGQVSGTLNHVISRLLQSYDFVLSTSRTGEVEAVIIFGLKSSQARPSPSISRPVDGRSNVGPREESGN